MVAITAHERTYIVLSSLASTFRSQTPKRRSLYLLIQIVGGLGNLRTPRRSHCHHRKPPPDDAFVGKSEQGRQRWKHRCSQSYRGFRRVRQHSGSRGSRRDDQGRHRGKGRRRRSHTCSRPKVPGYKTPHTKQRAFYAKTKPKKRRKKNPETPSLKITAEKSINPWDKTQHRRIDATPKIRKQKSARRRERERERERDRGVREEGCVEISWRRRAALRKITFFIQEANRIMDGWIDRNAFMDRKHVHEDSLPQNQLS